MPVIVISGFIAATLAAAAVAQAPGSVSSDSLSYQGVVSPSRQVVIIAPLDGVLAKMPFEEGQHVKAGDVLIQLDDEAQKLMVEGAKLRAEDGSQLKQAELALEDAQMKYDQAQELFNKGAMSTFELQRARLERDMAQSNIEAAQSNKLLAKANLALEQEKLNRYKVKAAFDGTITRIVTEEASTVTQNEKLMQLSALDKLEGQLYLPITMFGKLELGKQYELQADDPVNARIPATLSHIDRIIDTASRTFRCTFTVDNTDDKLPAGFMARLVWEE